MKSELVRFVKGWSGLSLLPSHCAKRKAVPGALSREQEKQLFDTSMSDGNASAVYYAAIVAANTTTRG